MIVARRLTGEVASLRWGGAFGGSPLTVCVLYAGPVLILALFTAGRDRATGIIGLAWVFLDILNHPRAPVSTWIELWLLTLAGFVLILLVLSGRALRRT